MMVEGFVVESFPVVFDTREDATRAGFPSKLQIERYEEREEREEE